MYVSVNQVFVFALGDWYVAVLFSGAPIGYRLHNKNDRQPWIDFLRKSIQRLTIVLCESVKINPFCGDRCRY